jgi:RNA recognition motif-containing protein
MKNVFVGNLYSGTTPAVIRDVFAPHGVIQKIDLMIDRATGLSRGFAFIEMADSEADTAIAALHGRIVDGQTITVREGRPKLYLSEASPEPTSAKV